MDSSTSLFNRLSAVCRRKSEYDACFPGNKLFAVVVSNFGSGKFDNVLRDKTEYLLSKIPDNLGVIQFSERPAPWGMIEKGHACETAALSFCVPHHNEDFVRTMHRRLNLGDDAAILVTDSLLSKRFLVLPTYRKTVVEDIISICTTVENIPDGVSPLNHLIKNLPKLKGIPFRSKTEDGRSLARNIMETVAIWSRESSDSNESARSERCVKQTLKRLKALSEKAYKDEEDIRNSLNRYSDYFSLVTKVETCGHMDIHTNVALHYIPLEHGRVISFDDDEFEIGDVLISNKKEKPARVHYCFVAGRPAGLRKKHGLGSLLSILKSDMPRQKEIFDMEPRHREMPSEKYELSPSLLQGMEKISCREIFNYNELLPRLLDVDKEEIERKYSRYGCNFFDNEEAELDLKPLGNHLANAIEEEVNASLVQLIRTFFDIGMPEHYRMFDNGRGLCAVQTRNKSIYLNKRWKDLGGGRYSVKPICLGETGCVLKEKIDDEIWQNCLGIFGDRGFIEDISDFARLRDSSSHAGTVKIDEFKSIYESFRNIVDKYLPDLIELKRSLRRKNYPSDISGPDKSPAQ